ncbi:uncharacterized protein LOC121506196 [Cheilinus undulatus]|uniref:uncharacterized protein LOC121506196 n=1 Tax=Cheilinus undulatus TaxID=241271 RepID=UPI001BD4B6AF|nr:uncharacterized protein LOC121506196 [Cheilinus undulatus]
MWRALKQLGLFYVFLLFFSVSPNDAEIVYKATGEDVVLSLPLVESPIQRVQWKHNGDIAAEMYGKEVQCLLQFKGRCEVNTDSGVLTVKELYLNDSGIYTPEINGRVFSKAQLSVISRVAKPSVKTSCNTEMAYCRLTCEGNTTNAKPVIREWFLDGRDGPSQDDLIITEDTKENSFRCMMMNPVSNETSESVTNPFIKQTVPVYGAAGEDVILRPPLVTETIQSIEWKHNENIAAGWYGNEFECLGQFKGRCEVNTDSGALTIKGLNLNDSGIYTPEINGKVFSKTQLSVISCVAKPSVKTFCNTEMTNCRLICEGNTAEAEPITYTWFLDGKHGPSDKVLTITKDTKENSFRCLMMNPVSNETSENVTNPIIKQERDQPVSIPDLVAGIVLVVIVVAIFICMLIRGRRRKAQYQKLQRDLKEKRQQKRARIKQQKQAHAKKWIKEQEDAKKRIKELEGKIKKMLS